MPKPKALPRALYNTYLANEALNMTREHADVTRKGISDLLGRQRAIEATMESAEELRTLRELETYVDDIWATEFSPTIEQTSRKLGQPRFRYR